MDSKLTADIKAAAFFEGYMNKDAAWWNPLSSNKRRNVPSQEKVNEMNRQSTIDFRKADGTYGQLGDSPKPDYSRLTYSNKSTLAPKTMPAMQAPERIPATASSSPGALSLGGNYEQNSLANTMGSQVKNALAPVQSAPVPAPATPPPPRPVQAPVPSPVPPAVVQTASPKLQYTSQEDAANLAAAGQIVANRPQPAAPVPSATSSPAVNPNLTRTTADREALRQRILAMQQKPDTYFKGFSAGAPISFSNMGRGVSTLFTGTGESNPELIERARQAMINAQIVREQPRQKTPQPSAPSRLTFKSPESKSENEFNG